MIITIDPPTDTNPVGTDHTVTATITDSEDAPQPGIVVTFTVTSGPNAGVNGTDTTNSSGQASFTYTDTGGEGTDFIQACYTDAGNQTICSQLVNKVWNPTSDPQDPSNIALTPDYDLNLVGEDHTVVALVTNSTLDPQPGIVVTFTVFAGPNAVMNGTDTTNATGQATYTYTGTGGVGTDLIQACFTTASNSTICSAFVEKEWTTEVIDITPLRAENPLNTEHTVTATVQDLKGNLLSGILVSFGVINGPNTGDSGTNSTNSTGQASFTYTGDAGPGEDVIRACFTNANGTEVCTDFGDDTFDNDAFKVWGASSITVVKQAQSGNNPIVQTFEFTGDLGFFILGDGDSENFPNLAPGNYTIFETVPAGWELLGVNATGNFTVSANSVEVELGDNENMTVTFTNNDLVNPIPTLTEWGVMAMALLLAGTALLMRRRGYN